MTKKNNQSFNLGTLKKNLQNLISQNNLTQKEFGEIAGMEQSRVSTILDPLNNQCITVAQLAEIATHFGVSVDDLLGIEPTKKTNESITLADSLEKLFEVDDKLGFEIGLFDIEPVDQGPASAPRKVYALYFSEQCSPDGILDDLLYNILYEWYQLKYCDFEDYFKYDMMRNWKKDKLLDGGARPEIYHYLNTGEQNEFLVKILLDNIDDMKKNPNPEDINGYLLYSWNRDLLEYDINHLNVFDHYFSQEKIEEIREAVEWLLNNTTPIY